MDKGQTAQQINVDSDLLIKKSRGKLTLGQPASYTAVYQKTDYELGVKSQEGSAIDTIPILRNIPEIGDVSRFAFYK